MKFKRFLLKFTALTVFALVLHIIYKCICLSEQAKSKTTFTTTSINLRHHRAVSSFVDYAYIHRPRDDFCGKDPLFVAFVPVSPKNFEHRILIRSTWAQKQAAFNFKVVFMMGHDDSNSSSITEKLNEESVIYGDIVQTDFFDTYYNLTIKTMMGFRWVSTYCANAKYTLKVDDDIIVSVTHLTNYLNGLVKNSTHRTNSLLCMYYQMAFVKREKSSKFYLAKEEHLQDYFDPYCDGQAYMLTTDLVGKMYNASMNVTKIKFEDVYVGVICFLLVPF